MDNREYRSDGRTCAAGVADFSLCGDAVEGDEDLAHVVYTRSRGPITCPGCCAIIQAVREDFRGVRLEPET